MQASDSDSNYEISEFPSPQPNLEEISVESSQPSNIHNSQVGFVMFKSI